MYANHSKELLEANADVVNLKLEKEALSNMYLKRIKELNNEVEDLSKRLEESESKNNILLEKIKKRDAEIKRLDSGLQKQIQLTSIAQFAFDRQKEYRQDGAADNNEEKHILILKFE